MRKVVEVIESFIIKVGLSTSPTLGIKRNCREGVC